VVFFPNGLMLDRYVAYPVKRFSSGWSPVEVREGLGETIVYLRKKAFGETVAHRMLTNSHSMSSTVTRDARYMRLFVYWPVALHPDPKSALLISYGVGVTAKAITDTAAFEEIDFVDISSDVFDMNRHVYPDAAQHPVNDPRVKVHVEDGRYFLQTTDKHFDIITGEPPPPKLAGVVSLYTTEYFALVRDRLNEGGIATYWLPVHNLNQRDAKAILRAFCDAFDDCTLWAGAALDWMMVGTRNARGPVSDEHIARQWNDPIVGPALREVGFETPEQLGALFMGGRDYLLGLSAGVEPLSDRHPKRLSDVIVDEKKKFLEWIDSDASRRRFANDPLVERLWPPATRAASSRQFDMQADYERKLTVKIDPLDHMRLIHRWLTSTSLETAPLWYLKSDRSLERAARKAWAAGRRGPDVHYHLGTAALVQRDFAQAASHYRAAAKGGSRPALSQYLELYALALDGRCEEGRAIRAGRRAVARQHPEAVALLEEICPRPTH